MASAASLIEELKQGEELRRHSYSMSLDSLNMVGENCVAYASYLGEGEFAETQYFTLEDISTWTDDGDWEAFPKRNRYEY